MLEQSLRQREEELAALRRDIRATQLKEVQIEKEAYYNEVVRLQDLAESLERELNEEIPQSKRYLRNKADTLQDSLASSVKQLEALTEDNQVLSARLKARPESENHQTAPQVEIGEVPSRRLWALTS